MRDDATKIHKAVFANGEPVIVAEAGFALPAGNSIAVFKRLSLESPLLDEAGIEDLAKRSMMSTRHDVIATYPIQNKSVDDINRIFGDHSHTLLFASCIGGVFRLGEMDFSTAFLASRHPYVAVGNSKNVADFMLRRFNGKFSEMSLSHAAVLAVSVVLAVMEIDASCGGPVQVATLTESECGVPSDVEFVDQELVDFVREQLTEHQKTLNENWKHDTYRMMEELSRQFPDSTTASFTTTTTPDQ